MKIFLICISLLILSIGLCIGVDLQFLDWPFSHDNNKFVFTAGAIVGFIGLLPLIGVEDSSLKKRLSVSLFIIMLAAFFFYIFNLVLFTI
jgi:hypothetical protein